MKQRCWKELKSQLCPKQKWVKDSEHSKCQCCSKQFIFLVRKRHHCRFCGNLFCSQCSDYFINGKYIGQIKEKFVRHCQFCHKKIEKLTREWTKAPEIYEQKNLNSEADVDNDDEIIEDEEDDSEIPFNLNKMFEQVEKNTCENNQILGEKQNKILNQAAQDLCQKFSLSQEVWKQKLVNLAQRAANETKMQVLVSEGSPEAAMDIIRRVKVKTILAEKNKAVQAMVKGIVFEKNATSKSMQTHLSNPRVIIIESSIDLDSLASFIKFEELIKNDKAIMKKILQKIVKLNPDIIFVENNVHVFALEYFQSKQIVVVNKLKPKQLQMIKQVTGIKKSIKKLWMLEKYKHQCIIGKCDKIYFKTIKQGQMMMFIEAAEMGIRTILLGEENEEETSNLKKSMQFLLRMARQLNLQKHFILIEKQLKSGINRKDCILPVVEDFSPVLYQNIETFSGCQDINFSKIIYYSVRLSQSPKNFQEYAQRMGKSSFKQMCGKIQFITKRIYSPSDFTLGAYILMKAANFDRQCKKCLNNHKEKYYINNYVVTIETEKKVNSSISKSPSSSTIIQIQSEEEFTLEKLKSHLTKQKQLIIISTHAQCELCRSVVGPESSKVGKLFLSNSFHHILRCLVVSYNSALQQYQQQKFQDEENSTQVSTQNSRKFSRRKLSMDRCDHSVLAHVYEYAGFQIKISIDQLFLYSINYIDLTQKQSLDYMKEKEIKYVKSLYEFELNEKMKILERVSNQLDSVSFPNTSVTPSFAGNQKYGGYFDSCLKLKQILQKCKVQLKQIQKKAHTEIIQKGQHDWTIQVRKILKVQSILHLILMILDEVEKNLRKKKTDDPNQSFDSSIVIQNNEYIERSENQDTVLDMSISTATPRTSISYETYLDEETKEYLKKKSRKIFPRVKGEYFLFHTAYINDPVSLLAVGVNSNEYQRIFNEQININTSEFTVKMTSNKTLKTDWGLRAETQKIYKQIVGEIVQKSEAIEITVYYPKQFQSFRQQEGINNQLYARGLCTCKSWDSSGGKSNSLFAKAENDLLVVKVIHEKQFDEFLKFAKDYIEYMKNIKKGGRETLLAKVFGIYAVSAKNKVYKCVVMQNIFFGLQSITKVYDLKGSQVNRLNLPPEGVKSFTGQDTNFKIDKEGEPYIIQAVEYDKIIKILQEDSVFLREHAVIDYSLLVIQSKDSLRLGIIDYMRPYQLMQKLETIYKEFKSGRDPTVIPPHSYAERFISAMKRYFLKIQ